MLKLLYVLPSLRTSVLLDHFFSKSTDILKCPIYGNIEQDALLG